MMTGGLLKQVVLAFFLMVAINQISPLICTSNQADEKLPQK
jgi:hypothetical protein